MSAAKKLDVETPLHAIGLGERPVLRIAQGEDQHREDRERQHFGRGGRNLERDTPRHGPDVRRGEREDQSSGDEMDLSVRQRREGARVLGEDQRESGDAPRAR